MCIGVPLQGLLAFQCFSRVMTRKAPNISPCAPMIRHAACQACMGGGFACSRLFNPLLGQSKLIEHDPPNITQANIYNYACLYQSQNWRKTSQIMAASRLNISSQSVVGNRVLLPLMTSIRHTNFQSHK